jgi:hypothetical protein
MLKKLLDYDIDMPRRPIFADDSSSRSPSINSKISKKSKSKSKYQYQSTIKQLPVSMKKDEPGVGVIEGNPLLNRLLMGIAEHQPAGSQL